ncbi:protein THEM6-like [Ostrea edulis]|uniref:protein THEM6-like n=1 Tax=Ostrea edulis TaxID=37623 RepID=UPI002094708E|nr:protein THEM6-like [Ostrea edulis]
MIVVYLVVTAAALALFDIAYFIRLVISGILYSLKWNQQPPILEESLINGLCWFSDMDANWHMNNSRYLRECDFARMKLLLEKGIWKGLQKCNATIINGGSTIRYRKSLQLFDFFQIRSKILHWDSKAFYIEHQIVETKTNFVSAIAIVKMVVKGASPESVINNMNSTLQSPPPPLELQRFIELNQISSEKLRKTL